MVLMEFLFAGKNIEEQEFHSSEKVGDHNYDMSSRCFIARIRLTSFKLLGRACSRLYFSLFPGECRLFEIDWTLFADRIQLHRPAIASAAVRILRRPLELLKSSLLEVSRID
jgi:hypothetical protein